MSAVALLCELVCEHEREPRRRAALLDALYALRRAEWAPAATIGPKPGPDPSSKRYRTRAALRGLHGKAA